MKPHLDFGLDENNQKSHYENIEYEVQIPLSEDEYLKINDVIENTSGEEVIVNRIRGGLEIEIGQM